jgi:hypothetical protein
MVKMLFHPFLQKYPDVKPTVSKDLSPYEISRLYTEWSSIVPTSSSHICHDSQKAGYENRTKQYVLFLV